MRLPGKLTGSHPLVGWLNQLREFAASCQLTSVVGGRFSQGVGGTQLFLAPGGGAKGGGGSSIVAYTFVSHHGDYIVARPIGGDAGGADDVNVAKPWVLRQSRASSTWPEVGGVEITYDYTGFDSSQERTATWDTGSEVQMITAPYTTGALLIVATVANTGVTSGGVDLGRIDLNPCNRKWAKKEVVS